MTEKAKKPVSRWFTVAYLVLAGVVVFTCALPDAPLTPEQRVQQEIRAKADKLSGAMWRCQQEAKAQVADADGFDAAPHSEWQTVAGGTEDSRRFVFQIKARNAFGALIWSEVSCDANYDGEFWSADVKLR